MSCGILWSSEEDARLRAAVTAGRRAEDLVADMPGRTEEAISKRARRLRLRFVRKRRQPQWSDDASAALRQYWNIEKLSASECAKRLGVTRNAAIGKAHRLNLDKRASPIKRRRRSIFARIKAFGCEWITGTPGRDPECGKPCEPGKPYCADHQKLVMGKKKVLTDAERKRRADLGRLSMKRMNSFFFVR